MSEGSYKNISIETAQQLLSNGANVVDIRDAASFAAGQIEGALHLSDENLSDFVLQSDHDVPLIVCCYHGHSSQQAAMFLSQQGFEEVYSLLGGYTAWAMTQ